MSVTFAPAMAPIVGWDLACVCGARYLEADQPLMAYEEALGALTLVKAQNKGFLACEDEDCFLYGIHPHAVEEGPQAPEVNMANGNTVAVMEALGIKTDEVSFEAVCSGSLPAEDFLGRVLMALAVAPVSAERPTLVEKNEGQATFVQCGVREGYVQEKLLELQAVAEFAVRENREVSWA